REPVLKLVTGFTSDLRGKEAPRVRNALEFVLAALTERDAGARDEILDRAGDQDFVGTRQGTDASGDVDGETGEIGAADFALSRVQARSHIDPEGLGGFGDGLGAMSGARLGIGVAVVKHQRRSLNKSEYATNVELAVDVAVQSTGHAWRRRRPAQ